MVFQVLDNPTGEVLDADVEDAVKKNSKAKGKGKPDATARVSLSEIGPRFVLVPVKIFEGSFGGATVFENKRTFVSSQR